MTQASIDCVVNLREVLTGAIVIALGNTATGVMGTDQQMVDELLAAGRRAAVLVSQVQGRIRGSIGSIPG